MRIPRRAEIDAFCGSPATLYQRLAGILAPVILLGTIAYILLLWRRLPESIPQNYNASGEITAYGGRGILLTMPIFGLVMDLVLALVGLFPKSWNVGTRVTVFNRVRVYRLTRDLMADLRLSCAVMFSGFAIYQATLPEHFSNLVWIPMILLTAAPLVRYAIRIAKR